MEIDAKKYTEKVIIFLDLLGIKEFITSYEKTEESRVIELYEAITRIVEFKYMNKIVDGITFNFEEVLHPHYSISALSDSIIITLDLDAIVFLPMVFRIVCISQINFLTRDVPIRGYVTIGKCYHDNTRGVIFGGGLIDAYQGERKQAIFPRVLIDQKVMYRIEKLFKGGPDKLVPEYCKIYPHLPKQGVTALLYLSAHNIQTSLAQDQLYDNRWCTRLGGPEVLSGLRNLRSYDGLNLFEMIPNRLKKFKDQFERTNSPDDKKIYEKWDYIHCRLPFLESQF